MRSLNADLLVRELDSVGLTITKFAQISRVHRVTIERAMRPGARVRFPTALKLQQALDLVRQLPKVPGADRVDELAPTMPPNGRRHKRTAAVSSSAAVEEGGNGALHTEAAPR